MAHLLREEGVVPAGQLAGLLREAAASACPLSELLVERGALTRPQRDRYLRTREVLGRACQACGELTYLLPGQGVRQRACERCGGRLRAGTSRRIGARLDAPPGFDEPLPAPRTSRRLEARASRRLEREAEPARPSIEAPRATGRAPIPPRPTLRRAAEALAPEPRLTGRHPTAPRPTLEAPGGNGEGLPLEVARVVRVAFEEARDELLARARREARLEAARELELAGAHDLVARLEALQERPAGADPQLEERLQAALATRLEQALAGLEAEVARRVERRAAEREAALDERAGRQATAALLAAIAGQGAAGRALGQALGERAPAPDPRLAEQLQELGRRLSALEQAPAPEAGDPEAALLVGELAQEVEAVRAEARADAAQVAALARLVQGLQARGASDSQAPGGEALERRLAQLEEGLIAERRTRTKEISEISQTHLIAAAEAARDVAREETARFDPGQVEERVREEGETALGELAASVARLSHQLAAIERQLEARVRRDADGHRLRHAGRRSLRLAGGLWLVLALPWLALAALYPTPYRAQVPLGPPTRAPYAGSLEQLRAAVLAPNELEAVASEVGLPEQPGWRERLIGLPAARAERLQATLEPFGVPPRAIYVRAAGLGEAAALQAAEALAARLESAAASAGAPLARIRPAEASAERGGGGWAVLVALLGVVPAALLALARELRRSGFQDAAELADLTDLPVLLSVPAEERDA